MNELPLEEVLEFVDMVDTWEVTEEPYQDCCHGKFYIRASGDFRSDKTYGEIYVLKTNESAKKIGLHESYNVTVKYNNTIIAGFNGREASIIYEKVKSGLLAEKPAAEQRDNTPLREKIKRRIAPRPEKLPLMRRLGR